MESQITVCTLLYGNFPELAHRVLSGLAALANATGVELRIGLNEVSGATRDIVMDLFSGDHVDYPVLLVDSATNRLKYPMMREMFYTLDGGIKTPYVMWFDDDSFVRTPTQEWLRDVLYWMSGVQLPVQPAPAMLGAIWTQKWAGDQREWVKAQPWYGGADPALRPGARFVTGGWWCANMGLLRSLDYPWPSLRHRGGDVMLGEALRQIGQPIKDYQNGVAINADATGRSGASKRRGHNEAPIGKDFQAPPPRPMPAALTPVVRSAARRIPRL